MAYDPTKPFTYGIPDGTYKGRPTTASFYEKNGALILDIKFAVWNESEGRWYLKANGYEWEANRRFFITTKDGAFNENTIKGIQEWAHGWQPTDISSFYWFQNPGPDGRMFGNISGLEVELNFTTNDRGSQDLWVHDPNRPRGGNRSFAPDGAVTDQSAILAKWNAKAKAVFAATPKKVAAAPANAVQQKAPSAPPAEPAAPAPVTAPDFPRTADGAFAYYCSLLGEPYQSAKHDEKWFKIFDNAAQGKDPDQFGPADVDRLFAEVKISMAR